jgi:hypothetical protein
LTDASEVGEAQQHHLSQDLSFESLDELGNRIPEIDFDHVLEIVESLDTDTGDC